MTPSAEDRDQAIDDLVRSYLDSQTEQMDTTRLSARISEHLPDAAEADVQPAPASRSFAGRTTWSNWFTWSSVAVIVLGAFLGGRYFTPGSANAAGVLQNVHSAHSAAIDRCYRVQYTPDPRYWNRDNKLEGPSESVLWTRGDRFVSDCTIGDIELTIGHDSQGMWISSSRNKATRFSNRKTQLPKNIALICDINSMSIPTLINDVLTDFDLRVQHSTRAEEPTTLIWASLKPDCSHSLLSDALLEVDAESHVLRRLVLWTVRDGQPRGTVTFTLLETSDLGVGYYALQSHVDEDAEIKVKQLPTDKQ